MHGIEFLFYTHADTPANYGVLFSAFCNEGAISWCAVTFVCGGIYGAIRTFEAELIYITTDRPTHIAGFVMKALDHLEDDDCLTTDDSQKVATKGSGWDSAIYRVIDIFRSQGYKVGGEEDATPKEKEIAIKEMNHFIDEFAHLDWEKLSVDKNGNEILSIREKACLLRLHSELYTSD